ncbi:MAG: UDP-N-acetylmuramoyl-L-alanine--D-glutamate ligase [Candidatus Krumholzibacteriota bacterium]|nr:UDP-N-acetylmuramoyl-L-alanine--D-glutamate ligase [Candidatus Krumholzibacteriota bacterium]
MFVIGMGKSGRAACALLSRHGYDVTAYDDALGAGTEAELKKLGVAVAEKDAAVDLLRQSDCVVVSPGVPLDHPLIVEARRAGVPVAGEIELAFRFTKARVVGVTGTNGKSTTVGIIGAILQKAGVNNVVAGNVGVPLADAVREREYDTVVLELSSFQLDTIDEFRADVAVLLNVTPDHLDRYDGSFAAYSASKARLLNRATTDTFYVYNADDKVATALAESNPGTSVGFSSSRTLETGVYMDGGDFVRSWNGETTHVTERSTFSPMGAHNAENAMAAIAAVIPFGVADSDIVAALRDYRALPHRMELVRVINGVAYINDSKATNVDAAVKSIRSVEHGCVVILGGRDKDGDFSQLIALADTVRKGILIGEATEVIAGALASHWKLEEAGDMQDAVRRAAAATSSGDTVLLAPACASFDMFENYEKRGEAFRKCVNQIEDVGT